jgi:hypothetical protein
MTTLTYTGVAPATSEPRRATARSSTLRLCVEAVREGLTAARRYQELQGQGVPRAEAAARAINETS